MKNGHVFAEGAASDVLTKQNLKSVYDIDFEIYKPNDNHIFYTPVLKEN